jgi:hypothetical protein
MEDSSFDDRLKYLGKPAWNGFGAARANFLGNFKVQNYFELVEGMMEAFNAVGRNMYFKIQFHRSYLNLFPSNLDDVGDESGKSLIMIYLAWKNFVREGS